MYFDEKIETMPRSAMEELQSQRLQQTIKWVQEKSGFYQKKFADSKVALAKMESDFFYKSYEVIFTNGDKATVLPTICASSRVFAPCTCTLMNLVAPSPSRIMACARYKQTSCKAA